MLKECETENYSESFLAFRSAGNVPSYEQNEDVGWAAMYGLIDGEPQVQNRENSRTMCERALEWPNTIQRRLCDFELADKLGLGRRTILCFFLVDPS